MVPWFWPWNLKHRHTGQTHEFSTRPAKVIPIPLQSHMATHGSWKTVTENLPNYNYQSTASHRRLQSILPLNTEDHVTPGPREKHQVFKKVGNYFFSFCLLCFPEAASSASSWGSRWEKAGESQQSPFAGCFRRSRRRAVRQTSATLAKKMRALSVL